MTLLSVNTTVRERPIYLGLTGLAWGLGTVLGPIIGGAFAGSSATWRWAFYINLCIGGFFAPVYIFLLPSFDPRPGVPQLKRLREIDVIGSILILGAFLSLIMGINFGGLVYAWNSGSIIALFVVSGILFIIFGLQQVFTLFTTEENRIFPVQFVYSRTMVILFIQTAAASTASFVP
jgi:MFS family permease